MLFKDSTIVVLLLFFLFHTAQAAWDFTKYWSLCYSDGYFWDDLKSSDANYEFGFNKTCKKIAGVYKIGDEVNECWNVVNGHLNINFNFLPFYDISEDDPAVASVNINLTTAVCFELLKDVP
ncbi:hypothetical protein Daus18300_009827 [Diaporthe australafricana]|uniref:Uncharacterized protein n=1 Tax=Diaporthe australafricana TaxID=127596 RepID=A0ABR3WCL1_9PEZI